VFVLHGSRAFLWLSPRRQRPTLKEEKLPELESATRKLPRV
jgi:hypothetical protein